jgi:O-Antigen ligase
VPINFANNAETKQSFIYWAVIILLIIGALMGGGARSDIQSLVILRPVTVAFLAFGLWHLRIEDIRANRFLFIVAGLIFALPLVQLIPLPSALNGLLAEHALIGEINLAAELGSPARPISLVSHATWNAWFSLFGPLAILVLSVQLAPDKVARLLPALIIIGIASAFLGIFQLLGPTESALYLYRITNFGKSVGLFSNRNHHAVMLVCLLPMLAVYAATLGASGLRRGKTNWRPLQALLLAGLVLPLILLTGSRSGLLVVSVGLVAAWACMRGPQAGLAVLQDPKHSQRLIIAVGLIAILLCTATLFTAQSSAIARLVESDTNTEFRYQMWQPIAQQAIQYLPFGSGLGSFVEAFQIVEPDKMLTPTYVNHAHNDWLETVMTTGIFGLVLIGVAVGAWSIAARKLAFQSAPRSTVVRTGQLGCFLVLILALASITDYPLRVPSIAFSFVIAVVWIRNGLIKSSAIDHAVEK